MVENPETGDETSFEDISPLKSAWNHVSGRTRESGRIERLMPVFRY